MPWSWSNIDWNGTGAMVQAVGSVLAIGVAVVIDRGSARRAEAERKGRERTMREDRILAIQYCAADLRDVARMFEGANADAGPVAVADGTLRRMDVTQEAIDHYVANPGEVGPEMIGTLVHARLVLLDGRNALIRKNSFATTEAIAAAAHAFRLRAEDIEGLLEALDGTMRIRNHHPPTGRNRI